MIPVLTLNCPTSLSPSDPSIKPKPTAEVDPTVFEKRFLKKVRDLGEVTPPVVISTLQRLQRSVYFSFIWFCIGPIQPLRRLFPFQVASCKIELTICVLTRSLSLLPLTGPLRQGGALSLRPSRRQDRRAGGRQVPEARDSRAAEHQPLARDRDPEGALPRKHRQVQRHLPGGG